MQKKSSMTEYFNSIEEKSYQKLKDAVALITVLISGADGDFDSEELSWAEKVTKIRSYKMSEDLIGFYQEVGKDFHEKLEAAIEAFPKDVHTRTHLISERLEMLNPILAKLDPKVAYHLYKSYLSFAEHVAKASGGFLGFFSVSSDESDLMKLPMLTPIAEPTEN